MGAGASVGDIVSGELNLTVVAGKDLVAKDGGIFSKGAPTPQKSARGGMINRNASSVPGGIFG